MPRAPRNPHFDDHRVLWRDDYSGTYEPVPYDEQFDAQWRLFLEGRPGFNPHPGASTADEWIADRIIDLIGSDGGHGSPGGDSERSGARDLGGRLKLDLHFSPDHFRGKTCLDVGCGAGRWTRALMALGAHVKSIDTSEHALQSVRRYNEDVEQLDLFQIAGRPDLFGAFDFVLCWGVIMCTHDPKMAFQNLAKAVKPGGGCYIMVYAPTYHNSRVVLDHRLHYHRRLTTFEEKLEYAYTISDRKEKVLNYLDLLNTFYDWVVEEQTVHEWFRTNGFMDVITLNHEEQAKCAYHVFGRKRRFEAPWYDDDGHAVGREPQFDADDIRALHAPFESEQGYGWISRLPGLEQQADNSQFPRRSNLVLLENGKPLRVRHAIHEEIRRTGGGLYSHWGGYLLFATSDNSDPNTNGRSYGISFSESPD